MGAQIFDLEIHPNYLLVAFYDLEKSAFLDFEFWEQEAPHDIAALKKHILSAPSLIGFNSLGFDNLILREFLKSKSVKAAKTLSDILIPPDEDEEEQAPKEEPKLKNRPSSIYLGKNDIDVFGILDKKGGLKLMECRLGLQHVLETPYPFGLPLTPEQAEEVKKYCHNDVLATKALWEHPTAQEKYKVKARAAELYKQRQLASSAEAEIASMVISAEIKSALGLDQYCKMDTYKNPVLEFAGAEVINPNIRFDTDDFRRVLDAVKNYRFTVVNFTTRRKFEASLSANGLMIKIGQGGLHSADKRVKILKLEDGQAIVDYDVSSYYPTTILKEKIAPKGLEAAFSKAYREILERRLSAKKNGDKATANVLKIVLNATYGKFGDRFSWLYNPKNELAVTLNCQLYLLMLIEKIALASIEILQANTDGITCFCQSISEQDTLKVLVSDWQAQTRFVMEETRYSQLVMKDVNDYLAKYERTPGYKTKGVLVVDHGLFGGGPQAPIIAKSAKKWFAEQIPPDVTVRESQDILDFCMFGKRDKFQSEDIEGVQKTVNRWIWGLGVTNTLKSVTKKATKTDDRNIILANDLGKISLEMLDIERYIQACRDFIASVETGKTPGQLKKEREKAAKPPKAKKQPKPKKSKKSKGPKNQELFDKHEEPQAQPEVAGDGGDFRGDGVLQRLSKKHPVLPMTGKECHTGSWTTKSRSDINKASSKHLGDFSLRLDSLIVMDLDKPDVLTNEQKEAMKRLMPETAIVYRHDLEKTKSLNDKGHFYFAPVPWLDKTVTFRPVNQSPVLELRTSGNSCINVPPSKHADGSTYKWSNADLLTGDKLPVLPRALFDYLQTIFPLPPKPNKSEQPESKLSAKTIRALEQIRQQLALFEVIDMYELPRAGEKIRCPFHSEIERTDGRINYLGGDTGYSLQIYPGTQSFHCFGCGANGDVVNLLSRLLDCKFQEALSEAKKLLKERAKDKKIFDSIASEPITAETTVCIADFKKACLSIEPKSFLIASGATGIGKTHAKLQVCAELAKRGDASLFVCSTVPEARRAIGKLKAIMAELRLPETMLQLVTARESKDAAEDGEERPSGPQIRHYRKIVVTTAGYVGRKGQLCCGYTRFHEMAEGRIVFFNEVQALWRKMYTMLPLLSRYLLRNSTYQKQAKCPKKINGSCEKCILAGLQTDLTLRTNERAFYREFAKSAEHIYTARADLGFTQWPEIEDYSRYEQINGTLFYKALTTSAETSLEQEPGTSYIEYVRHLLKYLDNAQIRVELPVDRETGGPVLDTSNQGKDAVQYPVFPCRVPILCGIDLFPALQLLGGALKRQTPKGEQIKNFEGAKAVVMTSATIPAGLVRIFGEIADAAGWKVKTADIIETPFSFDVTLLKTAQSLSCEKIAKIAEKFVRARPNKIFIVQPRRTDAENLVEELRETVPEFVTYFYGREFEQELYRKTTKGTTAESDKILLTYAKSAITKDEDEPDYDVLIVDCQQFIPFGAIQQIHPLMSKEERQEALVEDVADNLKQIMGRVLRSKLPRIPGQTVKDPRKIVVVLHGLPEEAQGVAIEPRLLHTSANYAETWLWPEESVAKQTETALDAICRCLDGLAPIDQIERAKKEITERAAVVGLNALSRQQRAGISKADLQTARDDKLRKKAMEMKKAGKEWREIFRALHLDRKKRDFCSKLKKDLEL